MKVATRVAAGSGLLVALLLGLVAHHLVQVRRLVRLNHTLAEVDFRSTLACLELSRQVEKLDEYTRKLAVTGDPAYAEKVVEVRGSFARTLDELAGLGEGPERDELRRAWSGSLLATAPSAALIAEIGAPGGQAALASTLDSVDSLRRRTRLALAASQESISRLVERSARAADEAARVSLLVAAISLGLAATAVAVTVRSIAVPLRKLVAATRRVAAGALGTRVDVHGSDELGQLALDFNQMVSRLDELDRLKRGFVSHVSHELKTPLVAMQETTRLLLDGTPGPLTASQRRMLELNLEAAQRLAKMIANLLDHSRLDAGSVDYDVRSWPLEQLLTAAVAELEPWAAERKVELRVAAPGIDRPVTCDRDRVIQVVQNLVDNAVKASRSGQAVEISASPMPIDIPSQLNGHPDGTGGWVRVAVSDRGAGVPDAEKDAIFEMFRQVGRRERAAGGVGLGLSISRQLVEAHGGRIWVEDNPGGGSVFCFVLPLLAAAESSTHTVSGSGDA